jgi:tRNA modification GTPase
MHCGDTDVIVAHCTPSGAGALALVRICGDAAVAVADCMAQLNNDKKLLTQKTHTVHFGAVVTKNNVVIDRVLFLLMRAPHTFTGQETVEITCHNNQFIIESIIQRAIDCGARSAQPGEFSRRAVIQGKIDLLQAEAIDELIHANTQHALHKALGQLDGSFSKTIKTIEDQLVRAAVFCQTSFEFIEEENLIFTSEIESLLSGVNTTIHKIRHNFDAQQHIRQGVRIVLIGSVNTGKSSLFNALLGKNRAIVTPIAGTTRDVIEAGMYKYGNYLTLIDTAGLRVSHDIVEQEGIKESAVYNEIIKTHQHKIIIVHNKTDIGCVLDDANAIQVSALARKGTDELFVVIEKKIAALFHEMDSPFLLNKRHYRVLDTVYTNVEDALNLVRKESVAYELISFHLHDALVQLADLTGKSVSEVVMDQVFRNFCVGK